jgi:hypothetical protein
MDTYGTPWTGDASRSASTFCYYYNDEGVDTSVTLAQVSTAISNIYGQDCIVNPPVGGFSSVAIPHPQNGINDAVPPFSRDKATTNSRSLYALSQMVTNLVTDNGAVRDYVANVHMDSIALGETVTIYIFDGSENLLGKRTFLKKDMTGMSGQAKKGTVAMSNALISRVQSRRLSGMGNEEVVQYLRKNMQWRV